MSGQSYSCLVCRVYLGRGKARRDAHNIPQDCIPNLEWSVLYAEKLLEEKRQLLQDAQVIEDTGVTGRDFWVALVDRQDRRRELARKDP